MKEISNRYKISKAAVLLSISLLLYLSASCAQKERETYTARKAKESLALIPEEVGFGVDIFLLLDQSGSMSGYPGSPATDPEGLRVQSSEYLIRNIAQKSIKELPHRIGIVNFGTVAPSNLTVSLTEVTKAKNDLGVQSLASGLKTLSLGDTSFISALEAAYNGFVSKGTFNQKRKPVIIIFTDGEPDDPRKLAPEKYFAEIENFIASFLKPQGCDVYVIGIDAAGANWGKSAPNWERILSSEHVYQISSMSQLRERFNETIRQIFGIPPVPPDVVTPKGLEFDVPPYLERIEFHIFPERRGLTLSISSPDGKVIDKSSPKVSVEERETYDIITVSDPAYGKWKYQILEGDGKIEVYRNAIPVRMKLISPKETHPFGKPMNLVASFLKPDGNEVTEIPEFPIGLTAKVISPDGTESNVKFIRGEKGLCFGRPPVENTKMEGVYRIILTMKGGDVYKSSQERIVQVKSIPYVMVDKPITDSTLHFSESLFVGASLLRNGKPIRPEDEFSDHPDVLILAQIVQMPDGGKSDSIWLSPAPDSQVPGMFHGRLPVSMKQKGHYILVTKLSGQLRSGGDWPGDYSEVIFYAQPSFWQRIVRAIVWMLCILAAGLVLILVIWFVWLITLLQMQGYLYIYPAGGESNIPLAQPRLERKKYSFFQVKRSGSLPARWLWVNRTRKDRTKVVIRYWEGLWLRSRRVSQNASINVGKVYLVKYM